ncbi:MAG: septal ring lytic transglycosylase RlpA family protein [Candidatus Aminicenantaceae bacterium]
MAKRQRRFYQKSTLAGAMLLPLILAVSCTTIRTGPPGPVQTGVASWYGPGFHGKKTSSREIYNMHDLTAAHQTLPFGTRVMVTNLNNNRSVEVRINDRGPFVKGRIIDLSYAAARVLDMIGGGTAPVRLEILNADGPELPSVRYAVQAGSFVRKQNAQALLSSLQRKYRGAYLERYPTPHGVYWRVRIRAESRKEAESLAGQLERDGYAVFVIED